MLDLIALEAQVEAMADHIAATAADAGAVTWTPALVRLRNRHTLQAALPDLLAETPAIEQDATCGDAGCGGLCLITHHLPGPEPAIVHTCMRCSRAWAAPLGLYRGEPAFVYELTDGAAPA